MQKSAECVEAIRRCIKVFGASNNLDSTIDFAYINVKNSVSMQVRTHDISKYSENEFEAYRKNFYPVNEKEKEENLQDFEKAWKHHYENNMHHWNWWAKNDINGMPLIFIVEMCCDWIAMSMQFPTKNALEWYNDQVDIKLGNKQKKCVLYILNAYYDEYNADGTKISTADNE